MRKLIVGWLIVLVIFSLVFVIGAQSGCDFSALGFGEEKKSIGLEPVSFTTQPRTVERGEAITIIARLKNSNPYEVDNVKVTLDYDDRAMEVDGDAVVFSGKVGPEQEILLNWTGRVREDYRFEVGMISMSLVVENRREDGVYIGSLKETCTIYVKEY